MRKIISFILCVAALLNISNFCVYSAGEDYDAVKLRNSAGLLEVTEIMSTPTNYDEYSEDVSRAEFAVYLANALGVSAYEKNTDRYYVDVPMDHWALNSINFLYECGILSMNETRSFMPDSTITKSEAYKMSVEAIGYGDYAMSQGGFPFGYIDMANRAEISDGVSDSDKVSLADASIIIANTIKAVGIKSNSGDLSASERDIQYDTILERFHNVYIVEGIVTAVPGISLTELKTNKTGIIAIDDVLYECELADIYNYIGCSVVAYCHKESKRDEEGKIILIQASGDTTKHTINAEDFLEFSPNSYKFFYADGSKKKDILISKGITVIKNGKQDNSDIINVFNINKGKFEFLDSDRDNVFEYVFIWEYANIMVNNIDAENEIIYDRLKVNNKIEYSKGKVDIIRIFDEKGNTASISDIQKNMLLSVYKSENYIEIHICAEAIEETIYSYSEQDGNKVVQAGTDEEKHTVKVDKDFSASSGKDIVVGMTGLFYYDLFGNLAYIDNNRADGIKFGYIIFQGRDEDKDVLLLKLLTENNDYKLFECASKTVIDGYRTKNISEVISYLNAAKAGVIGQVVAYKQNEKGEITEIDTSNKVKETGDSLVCTAEVENKRFSYASKNFGPLTLINSNTVCFAVPKTSDLDSVSDKAFKVLPTSWFSADSYYDVETYKMNVQSGYEDVLVCYVDTEIARKSTSMFVVDDIYTKINADGIPAECIDGYINGIKYTYNVIEGKSLSAEGIDEGDMIYLIMDIEGNVSGYTLFYDYSNKKLSTAWSATNDYNSYYSSTYMAYGNVLSTKDNVLKIGKTSLTTVDILTPCENVPITVCEENNGKVSFKLGNIDDIIGYDVSETHYSKIFIKLSYGSIKEILIYK